MPGARLVKIGGEFNAGQMARARDLGIDGAIRVVPFVGGEFDVGPTGEAPGQLADWAIRVVPFIGDRMVLAAIYRRSSLVLQPSEAEGFGLPLAEAMACGAPLLVSDLPVFREVAGDAAVYRPVGDVPGWVDAATAILREPREASALRREAGVVRSARYRWDDHVARLVPLYREVDAAARR